MLECVPNVSEGRDGAVLDALAASCAGALLDVHRDPDHHRSVFTLASLDASVTTEAVRSLASAVAERVDLTAHDGVHPRLGALDVVPFVAWDSGSGPSDTGSPDGRAATDAARDFAEWIAATLSIPVFLYGSVDPDRRTLPALRRDAFGVRAPDLGPVDPHPRLGAVAVGVRPVMIAVNVDVESDDLDLARAVAASVRERDGGLRGVRALGFRLASRGRVQVSMNLVDLGETGLEEACTAVRQRVVAAGATVAGVELVGMIPASEYARSSRDFREWADVTARDTLEARLARSRESGSG